MVTPVQIRGMHESLCLVGWVAVWDPIDLNLLRLVQMHMIRTILYFQVWTVWCVRANDDDHSEEAWMPIQQDFEGVAWQDGNPFVQ